MRGMQQQSFLRYLSARKIFINQLNRLDNMARKVDWTLTLIMSVVFGSLGVDRFIMGKIGTGLLKLVTFGGFGIWWLVDGILVATKYNFKDVKWT